MEGRVSVAVEEEEEEVVVVVVGHALAPELCVQQHATAYALTLRLLH